MKKAYLLLLAALTIILSGCGKPEDKLLGTWQNKDGILFTFSANNDLNVNNEIWLKYFITNDNRLRLGDEEPVPYTIKQGTLEIDQGDIKLTLTRKK
ncbi:hypothetical protein AGMMS50267_10110 [Spirochaetia bacterium]|nr:hypothetical protein AGMMS50267_10110 [Spirochaetia bacterium]